MRSVLRLLASGLVLSFLFVASVYSQGTQTGGITGVVTDQGGALVKGATVEVVSDTTGRSVRTVTSPPRCYPQAVIILRLRPRTLRRPSSMASR
jgi:hypothetical protein